MNLFLKRICSITLTVSMLLMPIYSLTAYALDDTSPQWASTFPKMGNMISSDGTTGEISVQLDEACTVFYVVLPADSSDPSALEVKSGKGQNGLTPVTSGNLSVAANTAASISLTDLTDITLYDAYLVAEDASGNLTASEKLRISTNVLAHFNFDGNAIDDSGNSNNGTATGTVSYDSGFAGQALSLSGSGYVDLPFQLLWNQTAFTVTMRFKTTAGGSLLGYQQKTIGSTSPNEYIPLIYVDANGYLRAELWIGTSLNVKSSSPVNDGKWHKVTMTATSSSISIYVDGVLSETKTGTVNTLSMQYNQIGVAINDTSGRDSYTSGSAICDYYTGLIDDVYILSKGIDSTTVHSLTSDAPKADTITVANNASGTKDTIIVSNLSAGDIVNVYDSETDGTLLGTATVADGAAEANIELAQLGTDSGSVYVSVTKSGGTESTRTQAAYPSEAAAQANQDITDAVALLPSTLTLTSATNNLVTYLQNISGMSSKGITLSIAASNNANIALDGTVDASTEKTGDVLVYVSKTDGTTQSKIISVTTSAKSYMTYCSASLSDLDSAQANSLITFTYKTGTTCGFTDTYGLQLTGHTSNEIGSAFFAKKISQKTGFSTCFSFTLNNQVGTGADGIVFIISSATNQYGSAGQGIGYSGINNSIGIEFDSYNNGTNSTYESCQSHIAIDYNGNEPTSTAPLAYYNFSDDYFGNSTGPFYVWVDYNSATKLLEVRINKSNTRPSDAVISEVVDLSSYAGEEYYVGYTSATGGSYEDHIITQWIFDNKYHTDGLDFNGSYAMDCTAPTAPTLAETADKTGVTVSGSTDGESGIDHYEYKIDDDSWKTYTDTITKPTDAGAHTITARAVDAVGNISDTATLSSTYSYDVQPAAPTVSAPACSATNNTVFEEQTATFTVSASTADTGCTLKYQWQKLDADGNTWSNISSATSASYTTGELTSVDSGSQYRCVVTSTIDGLSTSSESSAVTLTVAPLAEVPIVTDPSDATANKGDTATFSVSASVSDGGTLSYQWQESTDNSSTWSDISSGNSASYTTDTLTTANSGTLYRCVVTNTLNSNTSQATSNAAILEVAPVIVKNISNVSTYDMHTATFEIEASSDGGSLAYQWQKSTDNGSRWSNIYGADTTSYTKILSLSDNGTKYRCVITNTQNGITSTVYSNIALLAVDEEPEESEEPEQSKPLKTQIEELPDPDSASKTDIQEIQESIIEIKQAYDALSDSKRSKLEQSYKEKLDQLICELDLSLIITPKDENTGVKVSGIGTAVLMPELANKDTGKVLVESKVVKAEEANKTGNIVITNDGKEVLASYDVSLLKSVYDISGNLLSSATVDNSDIVDYMTINIPVSDEISDRAGLTVAYYDENGDLVPVESTVITENGISFLQFKTKRFLHYALLATAETTVSIPDTGDSNSQNNFILFSAVFSAFIVMASMKKDHFDEILKN